MATATATINLDSSFTPTQRFALHALRARYSQDRDLWTAQESARLRFVRWLVQTGRLVP